MGRRSCRAVFLQERDGGSRNGKRRTLSQHADELLLPRYGGARVGGNVVSARWRNMSHLGGEHPITANQISGSDHLQTPNSELALRSCDLTPLDFFIWGHLKDRVYANKPTASHQRASREHRSRMLGNQNGHLPASDSELLPENERMSSRSRPASARHSFPHLSIRGEL